jgi:hypothetical protein
MTPSTTTRQRVAIVLAIVAALAVVASATSLWANRTVLDSDRFAAAAAGPLAEPQVVDAIAAIATDQLVDLVLAVADPRRVLPGPLQSIGSGAEGFVRDRLSDAMAPLVRSGTVQRWLVGATRTAHSETLALFGRGDSASGLMMLDGDVVRMDLTGVLAAGLDALVDRGLAPGGLGGLRDALRGGLDGLRRFFASTVGVDIGEHIGTVVVYDARAVSEGGLALRSARWMAGIGGGGSAQWLITALLAGIGALALDTDRRRTIARFGFALAVVAVVAYFYWRRVAIDIEHLVHNPGIRVGVSALVDHFARQLSFLMAALFFVGLGISASTLKPRPRP